MRRLAGQRAGPVRTIGPSKTNQNNGFTTTSSSTILTTTYRLPTTFFRPTVWEASFYYPSQYLLLTLREGLHRPEDKYQRTIDTFHARQHQQWAPILPFRRRNHGGSLFSFVHETVLRPFQSTWSLLPNCWVTRLGQGLLFLVIDSLNAPLILAKTCACTDQCLHISLSTG